MTARFSLLALVLSSACASPPGSPSGDSGALAGAAWTGTLTVSRNGQPASSSATSWTFTVVPGTAGTTYTATIRSAVPELPAMIAGATTVVTPPDVISTQGGFDLEPGCRVLFGSFGSVQTHALTADFTGADCHHRTLAGFVSLTR
jgi:hypothetical protein